MEAACLLTAERKLLGNLDRAHACLGESRPRSWRAPTGIGRTLVTQARFVIENDPPAAAAVKAGATDCLMPYEAVRERLSEMGYPLQAWPLRSQRRGIRWESPVTRQLAIEAIAEHAVVGNGRQASSRMTG